MQIYESIDDFNPPDSGISVFIGKADALHLGHIALINETVNLALSNQTEPAMLSLVPDPDNPIFTNDNFRFVLTLNERLSILSNWPLEHIIYQTMNTDFTSMAAEDFIKKILIEKFNARGIVVGWDFEFGKNREGNIAMFEKFSREFGFTLKVIEPVKVKGMPVKTTRIRELLADGNFQAAQSLLGYPFFVTGKVIRGKGIGSSLGFPTANIEVPKNKLLPRNGVLFVRVLMKDEVHWGLANIGTRPTVEKDAPVTTEVWIRNFDRDITGEILKIEFFKFHRDEIVFNSHQELASQMRKDAVMLGKYLDELSI